MKVCARRVGVPFQDLDASVSRSLTSRRLSLFSQSVHGQQVHYQLASWLFRFVPLPIELARARTKASRMSTISLVLKSKPEWSVCCMMRWRQQVFDQQDRASHGRHDSFVWDGARWAVIVSWTCQSCWRSPWKWNVLTSRFHTSRLFLHGCLYCAHCQQVQYQQASYL